MIVNFIANLELSGKEAVKSVKAKLVAVLHYIFTFASSSHANAISTLIVATSLRNALNAEKRYRLTSDHSPVFSLFTFFPDNF